MLSRRASFAMLRRASFANLVQDSPSRPEGLRLTSDTMGDRSPTTGIYERRCGRSQLRVGVAGVAAMRA